jgi:hypothetical protein
VTVPVLTAKELAQVVAAVTPNNDPTPLPAIASQSSTTIATLQTSRQAHPGIVTVDKAGLWCLSDKGWRLAR